ncbi:MAG: ATP-dependent DNA helicase RecG [Fusobacteriaceae bacterium]
MYTEIYKSFDETQLPKLSEKDLKELKKLKNLNVENIYSLLYYFPRSYDERTNIKTIKDVSENEYVVLKATIMNVTIGGGYGSKKFVKARVMDSTSAMEMTWFGMPYIAKTLKAGKEYFFIGTVKYGRAKLEMINPEYKLVENAKKFQDGGEILPIYSLTRAVNQNILRKFLKIFLQYFKSYFQENIPDEIIKKYRIMSREEALTNIHFPKNNQELEQAKRRFAIEELLILEMGILSSRYISDSKNNQIYKLEDKKELVRKFLANMKFDLTNSQKKVITEIYKELSNGKIVNRLLQGDVGSGKTVVSMILLLYMVENGYQGVIMAPTEILATQHFLGHKDEFEKLSVKAELLTGSITAKNKKNILEQIKNGNINIVIGTHALIQDNVEFEKLGLIVIDEQHKFGVEQRKSIRDKGVLANLIVMSATPIPRSLALSIYGDLDVSIIDELPPGRKVIKTKYILERDENKMYKFIETKLEEGRQAYFVAPLIEESDKFAVKSVTELEQDVRKNLPKYKTGILHGKMSAKDKDEIMHKFKENEIQILVSTTVVEVGVNVPNATIMVVNNSERFGLSSLHQLRGRVGRCEHQSYCFLISKSTNDISVTRLEIMEKTNDGFKIAEEDLKLRKPGEIFGTRQSGLTDLKFVDIVHDVKTIKLVRDECLEYLKISNGEIKNKYLKIDIEKKFDSKI